MKTRLIFLLIYVLSIEVLFSQKLITKEGKVNFFSSTPIEDIAALNEEVVCIWDTSANKVQVSMFIKSFEFKKALMQEHFNENYMESDKYPTSSFDGFVSDPKKVQFSRPGTYNISVIGKLTIHGVTKNVILPVNIIIDKNAIGVKSKFIVLPADYNIVIPAIVRNNIAKEIEVSLNVEFK